jgi:nitrate reductase NapAB chaperone NapD
VPAYSVTFYHSSFSTKKTSITSIVVQSIKQRASTLEEKVSNIENSVNVKACDEDVLLK